MRRVAVVAAGTNTVLKTYNIEGALWAQKTFGTAFSIKPGATFRGLTIKDITSMLKSGAMTTTNVPTNIIVRNGQTIILNTRSTVALIEAGIPRSSWHVINRTGDAFFEGELTKQFLRNGFTSGTNVIRQTGTNIKYTN